MNGASPFDPRWLDLALALIALEGAGLLAWRLATGQGPKPAGLIANLAAGAFLLIVARELLTGAGALAALAALTAALVAHGFDLAGRWERKPKVDPESAVSAPRH
jgi:hypothetical protein